MMPEFKPDVPDFALENTNRKEKWILEQLSIGRQESKYHAEQNDTILMRQKEMDTRFKLSEANAEEKRKEIVAKIDAIDQRVSVYDRLKENFQGGRLVIMCLVAIFGTVIIVPLVSGFFLRLFEKYWK